MGPRGCGAASGCAEGACDTVVGIQRRPVRSNDWRPHDDAAVLPNKHRMVIQRATFRPAHRTGKRRPARAETGPTVLPHERLASHCPAIMNHVVVFAGESYRYGGRLFSRCLCWSFSAQSVLAPVPEAPQDCAKHRDRPSQSKLQALVRTGTEGELPSTPTVWDTQVQEIKFGAPNQAMGIITMRAC